MRDWLRLTTAAVTTCWATCFCYGLDVDALEPDFVPRYYCSVAAGAGPLSNMGSVSGEMGLEGGITEFLGWTGGVGWSYCMAIENDTKMDAPCLYTQWGIIYGRASLSLIAGAGQRWSDLGPEPWRPSIGLSFRIRVASWVGWTWVFEIYADSFRGFGVGVGVRY